LAQQAGKLDGEFAKLIDFFLQPQVSWQSLLAQYMSTFARDDFTYSRPSRRPGKAIFHRFARTKLTSPLLLILQVPSLKMKSMNSSQRLTPSKPTFVPALH